MYRNILYTICACLILTKAFSQDKNSIHSKDYGLINLNDCTPAFFKMLEDAKKSKSHRIIIEKGVYHFYLDKAHEEFCFISNNEEGLKRILFPIKDFNQLLIDGNGSEFIFHGPMIPFVIENSKNITVKNITIDWEVPLYSEGLIVANNPKENTFDLKITPEYPYEIRNGELIFLKEAGYEHNLGASILFDPVKNAVVYNNKKYMPLPVHQKKITSRYLSSLKDLYETYKIFPSYRLRGNEDGVHTEEIEPGLVRIRTYNKEVPPVGKILVCKGIHGMDRVAPAFYTEESSDLLFENVTIYHTPGMGIIAELCHNVQLENFDVTIRENSGRHISSSADATHFINCTGLIKMNECDFTNMLDDATNIHGMYMRITDILSNNKLGVAIGHYQQSGTTFGEKGDTVGLIRTDNNFASYHNLVLNDVQKVNSLYYVLTFDSTIPKNCEVGDLVENIYRYPEVEIANCVVKNNRARGLLISTPKKTLIKNCYFSTMMSAIKMPAEFNFWLESGRAENVTITNNSFGDCAYGGAPLPVIHLTNAFNNNFIKNGRKPIVAFRNIKITNNNFKTFSPYILEAKDVSGLVFENNKIVSSKTWEPLFPDLPAIRIIHSRNVKLKTPKGVILDIDDYTKANDYEH